MAEKFFKKDFRSKTAVTRCGYCKVSLKEENLESHCKTAHKKPKLAAGQKTLDSMFKRSHDASETSLETEIVPPTPTKKQKLRDEDDEDNEEGGDTNNNPFETEEDGADDSCTEAGAGSKVGDTLLVTGMGNLDGDDMVTAELVNLSADDMDRVTGSLVQEGEGDSEQSGNLGGDHLDRGTVNLEVEHNNNIVSLVGSNFASLPAKVEELTKTINAIKTSVDLIKTKALPDIAAPVDVEPSDERIGVLLMCKSLSDILGNFEELSYVPEEHLLKCDLCCSKPRMGGNVPGLFKYDKEDNIESDNTNLSQRFRNLKAHLKAHLMNKTHIDHWEKWKKIEEENHKFESRCHVVGLRIGRLCYDIYKDGSSMRSFEKEVVKAVLNGTDLGDLNHSKHFPDNFRKFVAAEVRMRTVGFLGTRLPQTGFLPPINVQADKGTTVHNTRQFTTVTTITPGSASLLSVVYLGQPIVGNHSGEGVADSIVEELNKYGIAAAQVEGGSFDGQYFHLSVPDHLSKKLLLCSQFLCTWDPLHKIGVMETHIRKEANFAWLVKLTEICQQIYKKFNWGKNYQALVEMCEQLDMRMRNLKTFSTTRFPNSVRAVFDTLIDDFKAVVKCLENIAYNERDTGTDARKRADDAKGILRRILSKSFVLQLTGTSDLYENFGYVANLCQVVDTLPFERFDSVMGAVGHFDKMLKCLDHSECIKLHTELARDGQKAVVKCWWPRYHDCLESLKLGKFMGVDIMNEHETKAYFTKLARKESDLTLSTKAADITRTKLESLVKRLSTDLKKDTFEKATVECIEIIRNVSDVRSFAIEVRKHGAVQTSHRIGQQFLESSRKISGTLDDIPDIEIKENFAKFLKVLEANTKHMEEKQLDSKSLIKLMMDDENIYTGIELTLQSIATSAVKISVESVVESLVSRYESHFDAKRQLKEINALDEMEISENGPDLVHADKILTSAMSKYWQDKSNDGVWHFCHKSDDIRTYNKNSKVVDKALNSKPKFAFMNT